MDLRRTYFSILGQINLECFSVVFEAEGCHGKENVLAIDRLAFFLLAFLRRW